MTDKNNNNNNKNNDDVSKDGKETTGNVVLFPYSKTRTFPPQSVDEIQKRVDEVQLGFVSSMSSELMMDVIEAYERNGVMITDAEKYEAIAALVYEAIFAMGMKGLHKHHELHDAAEASMTPELRKSINNSIEMMRETHNDDID